MSTSYLRRPRMKTNRRGAPHTTFLSAARRLHSSDSTLERVGSSLSSRESMRDFQRRSYPQFSHTHTKLHVTDGAAGWHSSSACPCASASQSTRCLHRCPCQSEIQPRSPLRPASTKLSLEMFYLLCSLDRCCRISSTPVPVNSFMAPSRRSTCQVHARCKDRESGVDERAELECHAA